MQNSAIRDGSSGNPSSGGLYFARTDGCAGSRATWTVGQLLSFVALMDGYVSRGFEMSSVHRSIRARSQAISYLSSTSKARR